MSSPKLLDQVRQRLRFRHYSMRTDQAYLHWIRRYIHFHGLRHPRELGRRDIEVFLTHLAVVEKLSASTQNQAMSALLFLYREVLQIPLPWVDGMVRAKASHREPVVLSEREVQAMLAHLDGMRWLVAAVLYSGGMRLRECLHLRVMDIDFECNEIVVRGGKGGRDRRTLFAARLIEPLRAHLAAFGPCTRRILRRASARQSCQRGVCSGSPVPPVLGRGSLRSRRGDAFAIRRTAG